MEQKNDFIIGQDETLLLLCKPYIYIHKFFQFWSYAVLTKAATEHGFPHGLCGGLAGVCGTLLSMPCDVLRTRMVAQGTPKVDSYF